MDDMDRAQARALFDTEQAIQAARQSLTPTHPQLIDAATGAVLCWDCNQPIPLARLAKHPETCFCVGCLSDIEARQKTRRN